MRFRTLGLLALVLVALTAALPCLAQTSTDQPQFFVAAGAGFNHADTPQVTGWAGFAIRAAGNTWSYTEFQNVTGKASTIQTGVLQQVYKRGPIAAFALGEAGASTSGTGALGGAFAGGGGLTYSLGSLWSKLGDTQAIFIPKALKTSVDGFQMAFQFGFGKSF
jgi:hypothetical protein